MGQNYYTIIAVIKICRNVVKIRKLRNFFLLKERFSSNEMTGKRSSLRTAFVSIPIPNMSSIPAFLLSPVLMRFEASVLILNTSAFAPS